MEEDGEEAEGVGGARDCSTGDSPVLDAQRSRVHSESERLQGGGGCPSLRSSVAAGRPSRCCVAPSLRRDRTDIFRVHVLRGGAPYVDIALTLVRPSLKYNFAFKSFSSCPNSFLVHTF